MALTFSKQECQPYTEKLMKAAKASCMNDLRNKYANKKGFFETVIGIFRRKK